MGIHVQLSVFADRVSDDVWQAIYEKARRVATQWTPRPLAAAWRHIGAVQVAQYTLEIETPDGLHLVGDAETLTAAESFVFPAKLECRGWPRQPLEERAVTIDRIHGPASRRACTCTHQARGAVQ